MTRVERQTMYLETFQKLKEQAADKVPPNLLKTWLGGAASMCLALAQNDDEVTEITYTLMLEFFQQSCEEI
jgi:hypothetical protein